MTLLERVRAWYAPYRERLNRSFTLPLITQTEARIAALSPGDRSIAYALGVLVGITAFANVYALENKLFITVPAYGGSLHEGIIGSPRFINPLLALSDADRDLSMLTHAGLMGLDGSGELVPVLAERYEISPDGKMYTFTLRENLKFSDGTPLTAQDVVYTVQEAQNPAIKSPVYANWSGVQVSALDERTVRFTLGRAYAPFLSLTTLGILPGHLWQSVSDEQFPFTKLQTEPVGAGPFVVTDVSLTADNLIESMTLKANRHYALGRPYLDKLYITFYPRSEDLATALASGDLESAYGVVTEQALTAPYARVFGVFFNPSEKQVYARTEVRKSLSLALDRPTIVDEVLGVYATAIMGPRPPTPLITPAAVPTEGNPTEQAAKALTSAGWSYDSEARLWSNKSAKQTLDGITLRTSNVPELKNIAAAVKADWEKLGIPVELELYEPGDLSQNIIRPRKYEALLYGMVIGRDHDLYAFWSSQERNDPGLNIALYANKTVDTLLEEARSQSDSAERLKNLQKIENTIAAEYPAAFIYAPDFTYVVPEGLGGVTLPQIVTPADRFASVATWYRATDQVWPFFARE